MESERPDTSTTRVCVLLAVSTFINLSTSFSFSQNLIFYSLLSSSFLCFSFPYPPHPSSVPSFFIIKVLAFPSTHLNVCPLIVPLALHVLARRRDTCYCNASTADHPMKLSLIQCQFRVLILTQIPHKVEESIYSFKCNKSI